MKIQLFITLLAVHSLSFDGIAQEIEYEVPVVIMQRGADQPLPDVKVAPVAVSVSHVFGIEPGHTDSQGKALVRFRSTKSQVQVNYKVVDGPDGRDWCLKFHGFFPNGNVLLPPHTPSGKPAHVPELVMEAFPADDSAKVMGQELDDGRSEMMGAAMAVVLTVPPAGGKGPGEIQLNDPLKSHETVAKLLQTTPDLAKNLVTRWQALVDSTPSDQKLDEKSLSALLNGDLAQAAEFAAKVENLAPQAKEQLVFASDTKRLVETVYQFNIAAQDNQQAFPSGVADEELRLIEAKIKPLRAVREGRFPASIYDGSEIGNFTKAVRERAANSRIDP